MENRFAQQQSSFKPYPFRIHRDSMSESEITPQGSPSAPIDFEEIPPQELADSAAAEARGAAAAPIPGVPRCSGFSY